ncbi:MAG: H+-translocating transhydrogenase subunit alpha [Thermomicrobiales bacterium]|nr:H+-translocating transhydrogenase subunit alpha [Thermomicrobiales bacterium]
MEPSASSAPNAPNGQTAPGPATTTTTSATPGGNRPTLAVPKETAANERRVALIPDAVKKYTGSGLTVLVQAGAGEGSFFSDDSYTQAGAKIVPDAATLYGQGDLILKVQKPEPREIDQMKPGATLIAFLQPMVNLDLVRQLVQRRITAFSMDAIPRTTRAQYMDALSSMATVAGYKAVLLAADHTAKFFPLLTTAAGTIPPAKVLIIGAGVAGLMAIGTARRLGAVVEAYDARAVVKEQVESLGAKFVVIDTGADLAGAGGYAKEATEDILSKQQAGLGARAAKSDIVITTAAVPGRPAPRLIPASTVEQMAPGSVIVDLAAETGGNCELTVPGQIVERHGVTIIGITNLPSTLPVHASQMYSKNIQNLLALMIGKDGTFNIDMNDDILNQTIITQDGQILHQGTQARLNPAPVAAAS